MKQLLAVILVLFTLSSVTANPSLASRPVQKTINGCVINGELYSSDGYTIRVRNLNLAPYEGKRIQVRGNLLPGDNFSADTDSLKVLGNCDKKPH
jgi:hypothetical protein